MTHTAKDLPSISKYQRFLMGIFGWLTHLRAQVLALLLLILLLMTSLTSGVAFLAFRQVSQSLAESRDQELVVVGAGRLSGRMENLIRGLSVLARQPEMKSGEPTLQEATLERGRELLIDFTNWDGGVIILDANGFVSVTKPLRLDLIGQDFSQESYFQRVRALRTFVFSNIVKEPGTNKDIIAVAVPITGLDGNFAGAIVGRFYVDFQGMGREILKLKVGEKGSAYLVDQSGHLIYHPYDHLIGTDFSDRQAIQLLQSGDPEGAITSQEDGGMRSVEGYAIVPISGWGLVIGEPWDQVIEPAQIALRPVVIVAVIGLIIVAGIVSVGVRRVTDAIQNLVVQTRQVAAGDYDAQVGLSRIREIRELGMAFNDMVQQIRRYRAGVRQYVADITRTQEEERKRIARELHDDTVQSLIAMGQRIELIKETLENPDESRARLSEVRTMVTGAIASVRQFSRDLRPLTLEDLGLTAAMQYLVNQLAQSEGIEVNLQVEGKVEELPADLEVAIYRILQEALSNVRKHAHATQVDVLAQFTPRQVRLTVEDNGCGFQVPESLTDFASDGNFGMMGLQERARLFGGNVAVESAPNQGTKIELIIPRQLTPASFTVGVTPGPKEGEVGGNGKNKIT
ncbi:MAG: HAMP domain-containing protein [Anaerolineae bacterium]|nr:HAMP domain-containing protein [Anaerolineae bacterium]